MYRTYLIIFLRHTIGKHRFFHEESVVCVSGGMGLGLEKSIEIPEGALDPLVGGHFFESHLHKNASKLCSHLKVDYKERNSSVREIVK